MSANHYDMGKSGVDQIPPEIILGLGQIYSYGEKKYGRDNWKEGMEWHRVYGSAMRHLLEFYRGNSLDLCDDSEGCAGEDADFCPKHSRLHHLWHLIWNAACLWYYEERGKGVDTRDVSPRVKADQSEEDQLDRLVSKINTRRYAQH